MLQIHYELCQKWNWCADQDQLLVELRLMHLIAVRIMHTIHYCKAGFTGEIWGGIGNGYHIPVHYGEVAMGIRN